MKKEEIKALNKRFSKAGIEEVLDYFLSEFKGRIALSSSLGAEDQVLTDMVVRIDPEVKIFTLDTGRMFPENYELIDKTNKAYDLNMEIYFPEYVKVEEMVNKKGINLFYESIENRKMCCHIRKIEPLKRALKDLDIWICGLRSDQSVTRINTHLLEWDEPNGLLKLNPLVDWTHEQVWEYIREKKIPYNALHDKGFLSIGCQPCTRALQSGEDVRAGRWWWEKPESKECGLHNRPVD
ncbi:MAG: phosphoadenylyl-sulfate reductase [Bacteroidales bacterium]|nr:phosphoadenylyl-sulfate reductase [Bacteroidales bacterium]